MTREQRRERRSARAEGFDLSRDGTRTERSPADLRQGRLRSLRRELARKHGIPAFAVFSDAVLRALAEGAPATPEELLAVPGVTPRLLEKFGAPVLQLLREGSGGDADAPVVSSRTAVRRAVRADDDGEAPTPEQSALYRRLKALRAELAREAGLPAYCIFGDRTLVELAKARPTTPSAMLDVSGVGRAKLDKYGEVFLRVLKEE